MGCWQRRGAFEAATFPLLELKRLKWGMVYLNDLISLVILTTRQITSHMNLKFNRIDMKEAEIMGRPTMQLRKRPFSSQNQKQPKPIKPRNKEHKKLRQFGTNLTNHQEPSDMDLEIAQQQLSQPSIPKSEIEPYLSSIYDHISEVDFQFQKHISDQLLLQAEKREMTVTAQMRRVLLRWLLQVGKKFQVKQQTMHICVQLIDYMLIFETCLINKTNFQLLGIAALFIASKYNEIHTYEAEKYVFVCDGLYTFSQLFQMEGQILCTTNFNLQFPTVHQFTGPMMKQQQSGQVANHVSMLSNLVLFDFTLFNRFKKHHIAVVVLYFGMKLLDPTKTKSKDVIEQNQIPQEVFRECFMLLLNLYKERQDLK